MRKRERWLTGALLLLMAAFVSLIGYSLMALTNLQEDLSRDPGEDMVWAIAQASYQNNLLLTQHAPDSGHRGNRALQHALLRGRLEVLLAPVQERFMERAGARESLLRIKKMLGTQQADHVQIQVDLHTIGQQIMRTRLDLAGERRDAHKRLLRLLIICIGGVMLAGGLLCWQLLRSLARVRQAGDQARRLLDALEREKEARLRYRDFVSVMSHQLRTPLAVIDSSAQRLARQGADADSVQARSQRIRGSVRQLNQLIARVLQGLRVDEQRGEGITLECQRCDWEELVRQALDGFDDLITARPVELRWAPGIARPLWIECDRLWCVEVLANLVSNANKYSPPGAPIDIFVDSTDGMLLCSVSDSGPGIPAERLERLFEPFYRGQPQESVGDGVGLGLSIARTLVHWHGGRLTAANRREGGACFTLQLPLRQ
ncbi:hypothetical protein BBI09_18700 [Stutzerimonas xanthomarina]|nr:hypothetical protein BBI09_18700 [Stutzerimonas xanthomarina]HBB77317.1 sensor histidine kinase [Pseudomonas sp.]